MFWTIGEHEQSPIHADRYTSIVTYRIPECKAYGKFLAQTRNVRSRSNCGVKTSIRIYVICTHNTGQAPSVMCLKSYSLEAKYLKKRGVVQDFCSVL